MTNLLDRHWKGPGGVAELLAIALPLFVSNACETFMMFTDRLFLAKLGPENMSAAMGGGLSSFMFMTFFLGITGYTNALVAQHLGAGRPKRCPAAVTQAMIVAVAAVPLVLACIPVGNWLFAAVGVADKQLHPQRSYFTILMFGSVLALLRSSISSFFSGIGRTRIIMLSAVAAMAVNVFFNYVLIFGKLGFPQLGIKGAACGTIIGSFAGLLVVAGAYFSRYNREMYDVLGGLRFDRDMMMSLLRFGYPAGLEFFLNLTAFNLLVMAFHSYGVAVAAAVTIAFNWDMVSFIPLIGVNIGVTSLVGRYMGAKQPDTAHRATMSALKLATIYSLIVLVTFVTLPGVLVGIFEPKPGDGQTREAMETFRQALPLAVFMVRLVSIYIFADAVGIVFSGALRGAGDTFATMCLSVSTHWLLVGVVFPMVKVFGAPPRPAWLTAVTLIWVIGLVFYARYRTGRWRRIKLVE